MNILIVTQYFWPENFRINDLALGFAGRGHKVTVLTGIPNYPGGRFFKGYGFLKNRREEFEGIRIIRVPLTPRGQSRHWQLIINFLSFAFFACLEGPFVCRQKFDMVFVYGVSPVTAALPAILLKRIKRIPLVLWILDLWPESLSAANAVRSGVILRMVDGLVRFIYKNCDRIFVASQGFVASVESRGIKPEKILYFPNWAEEIYEKNMPGRCEDKLSGIPEGFRIMFAGNIGVSQDFATILSAAEKLRAHTDIHWLILGDGRMLEWVKEQIRQRGLEPTVHLLGRHPLEEMPGFFSCADAMLVTLKKDPAFCLTVPGKIQSYLACGKSIVGALDGAGHTLLAESGAGLACRAGDSEALADAVLKMARLSETERAEMGNKGKDYYDLHFNRKLLFDKVEGWVVELSSAGSS